MKLTIYWNYMLKDCILKHLLRWNLKRFYFIWQSFQYTRLFSWLSSITTCCCKVCCFKVSFINVSYHLTNQAVIYMSSHNEAVEALCIIHNTTCRNGRDEHGYTKFYLIKNFCCGWTTSRTTFQFYCTIGNFLICMKMVFLT